MRRKRGAGATAAIAAGAVGLIAVTIGAATAATAVFFARKVVTPPEKREEDVRITRVDLAAGEITLVASEETRMRGRYGLWFDHDAGHARLGDVIDDGEREVRRSIDSVDFGRLEPGDARPHQRLVPPRPLGARAAVRQRRHRDRARPCAGMGHQVGG